MEEKKYIDISPIRDSAGNIQYSKKYDVEAINNSIMNLFTIEKGEVPGKPWLGNPLSIYLFENIGYFEQRSIEVSMRNTLELYEPRAIIEYIYVDVLNESNAIEINIGYYIILGSQKIFEDLKFKYSHNNMTSIIQRM